jgi:hypothetical protein
MPLLWSRRMDELARAVTPLSDNSAPGGGGGGHAIFSPHPKQWNYSTKLLAPMFNAPVSRSSLCMVSAFALLLPLCIFYRWSKWKSLSAIQRLLGILDQSATQRCSKLVIKLRTYVCCTYVPHNQGRYLLYAAGMTAWRPPHVFQGHINGEADIWYSRSHGWGHTAGGHRFSTDSL